MSFTIGMVDFVKCYFFENRNSFKAFFLVIKKCFFLKLSLQIQSCFKVHFVDLQKHKFS